MTSSSSSISVIEELHYYTIGRLLNQNGKLDSTRVDQKWNLTLTKDTLLNFESIIAASYPKYNDQNELVINIDSSEKNINYINNKISNGLKQLHDNKNMDDGENRPKELWAIICGFLENPLHAPVFAGTKSIKFRNDVCDTDIVQALIKEVYSPRETLHIADSDTGDIARIDNTIELVNEDRIKFILRKLNQCSIHCVKYPVITDIYTPVGLPGATRFTDTELKQREDDKTNANMELDTIDTTIKKSNTSNSDPDKSDTKFNLVFYIEELATFDIKKLEITIPNRPELIDMMKASILPYQTSKHNLIIVKGINCIDFLSIVTRMVPPNLKETSCLYLWYKMAVLGDKNYVMKPIQQLELPKFRYQRTSPLAKAPEKNRESDAGWDIWAVAKIGYDSKTGVHMYSTHLKIQPDNGFFFEIIGRSSLPTKLGHQLANCVGVIDSGYTGLIQTALIKTNTGVDGVSLIDELVLPCKIAQLIPRKSIAMEAVEVDSLDETFRGTGGFGSTGGHSINQRK